MSGAARTPVASPATSASVPLPWSADAWADAVVSWQLRHGRHDLPWQGTRDPYRVWLSEVMLQQTQVGTVRQYYARFLERFPDVQALASATEDEVLAAWSGLGYYRRARMAHACAKVVVAHHAGRWPASSAALAELPGIGRSTAAAIAAFCHGESVAILDGNVKRVLARALGFADDVSRSAGHQRLWDLAERLVPRASAAAYTQGLMDLGAAVCTARHPSCEVCPVQSLCVARKEGKPERYPMIGPRRERGTRESVWLWLEHRGHVWLVRRPADGVWAGLWSLPEFADFEALRRFTSGWPGQGEAMPEVRHALTHFDWTMHPRRWRWPDEALPAQVTMHARLGEGRWVEPAQALTMGLPTPWRRLFGEASGKLSGR